MRNRGVAWGIRVLLAALFLAAGSMKLMATPEAIASFDRLGLGQGFRVFLGACEVLGAVGLLITPLAALAASGLALIMLGAVVSHLTVLGGSPGGALLALVLSIAVIRLEPASFVLWRLLRTGKGPMDGWIARMYDRGVQASFRSLVAEVNRDLFPELAGVRRLLDVGCGPGQFTLEIAELLSEAEVCGVDLAPTMIELARQHANASPARARLRFEIADVAALPFPDGYFDAVVSTGSIKHWPEPLAGLREMYRVLRPGGRAYVAEINRLAPPAAAAAVAAQMSNWLFQYLYPRVVEKGLAPAEGAALFSQSPFGAPTAQRTLLDGCLWLFTVEKAAARV